MDHMNVSINTFFAVLCSLSAILFILQCRATYKTINRHKQSRARGLTQKKKALLKAEFDDLVEQHRIEARRRAS